MGDVVTVTDSLQNSASVSISVGNALVLNPFTVSLSPREPYKLPDSGGSQTGSQYTLKTHG